MFLFFYSLTLLFFLVPTTIIAYRRVRKGATSFTGPVNWNVRSILNLRNWFGALDMPMYYIFHALFLFTAFAGGAWLSIILAVVYMVYHHKLRQLLIAGNWSVLPKGVTPPPIPLTPEQQAAAEQTQLRG